MSLRVLDLFCGAGGFSEGFKQAGFTIVEGYDMWNDALTSYQQNHDCSWVKCNLLKKSPYFFPNVEVVIGSPPCVDFSTANPNADFRDGLKLVFKFLEVVCHIKPKHWVMENVPQVAKFLPSQLAKSKIVLNSADFGVPQTRKRCFLGTFDARKIVKSHNSTNTLTEMPRWRNVKDVLGNQLDREDLDHFKVPNTPSRERMVKEDVLDFDKPCGTITCKHDRWGTHLVPYKDWFRFLTPLETQLLMGFPSDYYFFGTKQSQYKQIGNAVCPPVAKAIAEAIKEKLVGETQE